MISSADVSFLRKLTTSLARDRMTSYRPAKKRSTAAIILRFGDSDSRKVSRLFSRLDAGVSATAALDRLERNQEDAPSSLELLFMKRADIREDRWSGRICFPGGYRDVDDRSDMDALVREVNDEIGFPLRSPSFILLGKMHDYELQSRILSRTGVVQSRFVFLYVGELTPTLKLNEHHVEALQWVALNQIRLSLVDKWAVMHSAHKFITSQNIDEELYWRHFTKFDVFFPSVKLPGKWRIWGLTYYNTSELIELAGGECLCWPLFDVNSIIVRPFVFALHGFWEWQDLQRRPVVFRHQLCLTLLVTLGFALLYGACAFMYGFGQLCRHIALKERTRMMGPPPRAHVKATELPETLPELPSEYDSSTNF
jgi:8-oxo-dGTP pyrophosphatase MutT (NUDIX family)